MRWVPVAAAEPHRCCVVPFVNSDREGFIDTGNRLAGFEQHVYVSVTAVRELARMIGLPSADDLVEAVRRAERAERERDDLREQLVQADTELNAVAVLKNSRQWKQERKPGRPARQKQEVA